MTASPDNSEQAPARVTTGVRAAADGGTAPALCGGASLCSFAMPMQAGDVVCGKYRIERLIGVGGVGFVVSATRVATGERVALKFLRPEFTTHDEAVRRFTIEARANSRVQSEHVVRVLDVEALPDGAPIMVMELLEGVDLARLLETQGPLPLEPAVQYVLQTCEALAAAHAAGIVHRDVKPENLFLAETARGSSCIKVLDFGISKLALDERAEPRARALTVTAVGSPPYMSPEQVRASHDVDARTDIWSAGCVLYELLTGHGPFDRMSLIEACAAVLEQQPAPLELVRSDVPAELEAVVMRCLRKDPDERFQNVCELADALARFAPGGAALAERCRRIAPPCPPARQAPEHGAPATARRGDGSRLRTAAVFAVAWLAGVVLLGGSYALMDAGAGRPSGEHGARVDAASVTAKPHAPAATQAARAPATTSPSEPAAAPADFDMVAATAVAAPRSPAPAKRRRATAISRPSRRPMSSDEPDVGF